MYDFITKLLESIDLVLIKFYTSGATALQGYLKPAMGGLLSFYIMLWVYRHLTSDSHDLFRNALRNLVRITLILGFSLGSTYFITDIAQIIYAFPEAISAQMTGASISGNGGSLQNGFTLGMEIGRDFKDAGTGVMSTVMGWVSAVIVWGATVAVTGIVLAVLITTKLGLSIVLALGPLLILMMLFEYTHRYFNGWVNQLLTDAFEYVVVILAMNIMFVFLLEALKWSKQNEDNGLMAFAPCAVICIVTVFFVRSAHLKARGITSGWHSDVAGMLGGLGGVSNTLGTKAVQTTAATPQWVSQQAGRAADGARNLVERFSRPVGSRSGTDRSSEPVWNPPNDNDTHEDPHHHHHHSEHHSEGDAPPNDQHAASSDAPPPEQGNTNQPSQPPPEKSDRDADGGNNNEKNDEVGD